MSTTIKIAGPIKLFEIGNELPITFIAGPCVIESRNFALDTASQLKEIFEDLGVNFIYKSSFDKANRSSDKSFRGLGIAEGLDILKEVREKVGVPILTDVHTEDQVDLTASVVDILQTPAFLCRQTDFIHKVASCGKPVNIKKGQFMSPYEMQNVLKKAISTGNNQISLCERGTSFGYGNLVVDMRSLPIMSSFGNPVVFDATHSVQLPGAQGHSSGGQREFVSYLASAAVATGIAAVFIESHPDPDNAPCDGPNMLSFESLTKFLKKLKSIDELVKK
ncbi:MAG: 3-deoxy-8-phosphooctulonate synthase [Sphingobacteriales bacterium]|nr:3-deoxy-8-phosphooctulonate synthase [Sphingobacteriales bacterium]